MSYVIIYLPDGEIVKPYSNHRFDDYRFTYDIAYKIINSNMVLYNKSGIRKDMPYYINSVAINERDLGVFEKVVPHYFWK
jgi:hypothetical protein